MDNRDLLWITDEVRSLQGKVAAMKDLAGEEIAELQTAWRRYERCLAAGKMLQELNGQLGYVIQQLTRIGELLGAEQEAPKETTHFFAEEACS